MIPIRFKKLTQLNAPLYLIFQFVARLFSYPSSTRLQERGKFHAMRLLLILILIKVSCYGVSLPQLGLSLHLDVNVIDGVDDGEPLLNGWPDSSGSGLTALGTIGNQPTYIENAGSNYPAVRFDGVGQYLELSDLSLGSEVSVFIVFANKRTNLQANARETLVAWPINGGNYSLASSGATASVPDYPLLDAQASGATVLGTWVNGHATSASTGDYFPDRFYVASAKYSDLDIVNTMLIGASAANGAQAGQNDIREILIYDRALTESERHAVHAYLGAKHDILVKHRSSNHPVESFPHPLGSQQFGTQYSFGQDGVRTLDYARATLRQGGRVVKFRLSDKYANTDGFTAVPGINTLVELVRDQPEVKEILDMPLSDYVFWVSTFGVPTWHWHLDEEGLIPNKTTQIYNEFYDLVVYLLQTYSGTGKRFYLGNWEGDWMLSGEYKNDPNTIPQNRIQGMIDWANVRQQALDDAKANTAYSDVEVWFYLEMNKADWMREDLPCVANSVIPAMPKLDMVSISSYSMHKDNSLPATDSRIHSDLDQIQALLDAKPDTSISGSRIMIGEYGWQYNDSVYTNLTEFALRHVDTARSFFSWQGSTLRFLFQWQFFNQAAKTDGSSKEMSQIGPGNDRRPLYYMHENFLRSMHRWVDDYYLRMGSLPSDRAYADQADEVLAGISLVEYEPVYSFSTYNDWRDHYFVDSAELQDVTRSGPSADPYQSGLPNLLRYGLGLSKFGQDPSRMPQIRNYEGAMVYALPFDNRKIDLKWTVEAGSTVGQWATLFEAVNTATTEVYSETFEAITVVTGKNNYSYGYDRDGGSNSYAQLDYGKWYKRGSTTGNNDVDGDGDLELRPNLAGKNNAKMWGTVLDPTVFAGTGSGNYEFSVDLIGADTGNSRIYLWYARNYDASGNNDLILDLAENGFSTYNPVSVSGTAEAGSIFMYEIPDVTVDGTYTVNFNYSAGDALVLVFASYNTSFAYDNLSIQKRAFNDEELTLVNGFLELNADAIQASAAQMFFRLQLEKN